MEPTTLQQAIIFFADPINCREYLVARRWPKGVACPRCGSANVLFLEKYNRWHCREKHNAPQFTLKTGTIFEDSPVGLDKWLAAMWLVVNCKNGISSYEIHRDLKVTQKTAWFLLHRIRLALNQPSDFRMGQDGGPVEADETFIGGKPKNMHLKKRKLAKNGNFHTDKPVVFGMLDRETRQVRANVIPDVKRETLQRLILDQVVPGSKVFTDGWKGYSGLTAEFVHETVNHLQEYVRGEVHTQGIENFWSLLKRGLSGTYVAVEPFHLSRYVGEQVFRFNNRATKNNPLTDADRFCLAVSQIVGKRLTYKELTGKEEGDRSFSA
jgi:transposase-like protein